MGAERPLRVLVVVASDQRRGAEIQGMTLVDRLATLGVEASVTALAPAGSSPRLDVVCLGDRPLSPGTLRALRRAAQRCDVVVAHGSTTLPACAVALAAAGVPFVYRSIGDPAAWVRGDLHRRRTGVLMRRAAAVVTLWPDAADAIHRLYRVPRARVAVIPNPPAVLPVALDRAAARSRFGLPEHGPVVAVVGSLTDEKRVDRAIGVVARLPHVHLLVVGDGPRRDELVGLAAESLVGRHTFTGRIADVENAYTAADLLLLTSSTEGFPGVVMEAAVSGLPSVAPRVGAVSWMAERGLVSTTFDPAADDVEIARLCSEHLDAAQSTRRVDVVAPVRPLDADTTEAWQRLLADVASGRSPDHTASGVAMSVTLVIDSLQPAGAEMSTVFLAAGLAERSISCSVVVLRSVGGRLEERLAEAGVPLVVLPGGPLWRRTRALRSLLRSERPDIVHTALFDADIVGRLAAVGLPTRVVSSLVSMPRSAASVQLPGVSRWKLRLVNALDRLTGRLMVDRHLAVTDGVARAFEQRYRIHPSRISVVERGRPHPGVDPSQDAAAGVRSSLGLADGSRLVVAVGRHARAKGFVDLVRAFADVVAEDTNAVLVIAGRDGDDSARIRGAIDADPSLDGRVLLVGHRDDVPALLAAADLFVLSSHVEGAAGAVIEAMASGTPIVATRLEGLAGVLEHDRTAVLCEAQDVGALASAMRRVLSHPALGERMAAAARVDYLERFTLERSVDATIALYRDVLGPR